MGSCEDFLRGRGLRAELCEKPLSGIRTEDKVSSPSGVYLFYPHHRAGWIRQVRDGTRRKVAYKPQDADDDIVVGNERDGLIRGLKGARENAEGAPFYLAMGFTCRRLESASVLLKRLPLLRVERTDFSGGPSFPQTKVLLYEVRFHAKDDARKAFRESLRKAPASAKGARPYLGDVLALEKANGFFRFAQTALRHIYVGYTLKAALFVPAGPSVPDNENRCDKVSSL